MMRTSVTGGATAYPQLYHIPLHSSMSVHEQLFRHQQRKSTVRCCTVQTTFITLVICYFLGSFFLVLYSMTSVAIQSIENQPLRTLTYHAEWHPMKRRDRFPTVQERIQRYMTSVWYLPPCDLDSQGLIYDTDPARSDKTLIRIKAPHVGEYAIRNGVSGDEVVRIDQQLVQDCLRGRFKILFEDSLFPLFFKPDTADLVQSRSLNRPLCEDLESFVHGLAESKIPLVTSLGDARMAGNPPIPVIGGWRQTFSDAPVDPNQTCRSTRPSPNDDHTILWFLHSRRHFDFLSRASRRDLPWKMKQPKAIWRNIYLDRSLVGKLHTQADCLKHRVCNFVYQHTNSSLIDASFGPGLLNLDSTFADKRDRIIKRPISLGTYQMSKVLIHFQTTDNAASLAWKLHSRSVVLMPPPTYTTWLLEELLEPFVHFLPLNETNAEAMVQWVKDHDQEAQRIGERASMWIEDLLQHPDAQADEEAIQTEMIRRYQAHWI